jgi:hypothetical protein
VSQWAQAKEGLVRSWEYMAVELPFEQWSPVIVSDVKVNKLPHIEAALNEWGMQGWELVNSQYRGGSGYAVFILKRERQ